MQKKLEIKISVDKKTGAIKVVDGEFRELSNSVSKTDKKVDSFNKSLSNVIKTAAGLYGIKQAFDATIMTGLKYNNSIEQSLQGLTALTVATSSNITATGKTINIQEKYILATKEATITMKELEAINALTPHTLNETNLIYKAMYVSMKKAGASNKEMIGLTKQLSIASGAAGIEFNSLLAGVDGLATGTVLANSDLGRFLNGLGLTNQALKDSDDVVGLVNNKLKDFRAADTMDVAISNLTNTWQQLNGELSKDLFENAKIAINDLSSFLNDNKAEIIDFGKDVVAGATIVSNGLQSIYLVSKIGYMQIGVAFKSEIEAVLNAIIKGFENSINFISREINDSIEYWNEALNLDLGKIEEISLGKVTIDSKDLTKSIADAKTKIGELGLSTDNAFVELATGAEKTAKAVKKVKDEAEGLQSSLSNNETNPKNISDAKSIATSLNSWQNYYETIGDYESAWLIKQGQLGQEYSDLNKEQYSVMYAAAKTEYFDKLNSEIKNAYDLITSPLDGINDKFLTMHDIIKDTFSTNDLQKFYDVWQKETESAIKKQKKYDGVGSKDWTAGLTGSAKGLANIGNAFKDVAKEQEEWNKFSLENKETEEDKNKHLQSQVGLYGNVAGAVGNMYEEGSAGALAMQQTQMALGIVEGGLAVIHQMTSGDVYSAIPRALAVAGMVSQFIGGFGGSGGSSSFTPSAGLNYEAERDTIEATYSPITDRLDRQIELLRSIDLNGSSSSLELELASSEFKKDYELFKVDVLEKAWNEMSVDWGTGLSRTQTESSIEEYLGFDLSKVRYKTYYNEYDDDYANPVEREYSTVINESVLREGLNVIKLLEAFQSGMMVDSWNVMFDEGWSDAGISPGDQSAIVVEQLTSQFQGLLYDFTSAVVNSLSELKDAKNGFMDSFDSITGTTTYATLKINEAFSDVEKLTKGTDLASYLKTQIEGISKLEEFFTESAMEILLSQDPTKLQEQLALVESLEEQTGITFENGAKDALNYLESIELVSEAMATSSANIKSWTDSFKTDAQITQDLFRSSNQVLASTFEELDVLFLKFASDAEGLSDVDLNLLKLNKSHIYELADAQIKAQEEVYQSQINGLNETKESLSTTLSNTTSSISLIESSMNSLIGIIDKLKSSEIGSTYTIDSYFSSMDETLKLSKSQDIEAFSDSLKNTIKYSSGLFEDKNFENAFSSEFERESAVNQFESMDLAMETELSVLQQIELNTKASAAALEVQISGLNLSISELSSVTSLSNSNNTTKNLVSSAYEAVLGRKADSAGSKYWIREVDSGNISIADLSKSLAYAALDFNIADYSGSVPSSVILNSQNNAQNWLDINGYANGGISSAPQVALVSEGAYKYEAHVPLPDGRAIPVNIPNNNNNAVIVAINRIGEYMQKLTDVTDDSKVYLIRASKVLEDAAKGKRPFIIKNKEAS